VPHCAVAVCHVTPFEQSPRPWYPGATQVILASTRISHHRIYKRSKPSHDRLPLRLPSRAALRNPPTVRCPPSLPPSFPIAHTNPRPPIANPFRAILRGYLCTTPPHSCDPIPTARHRSPAVSLYLCISHQGNWHPGSRTMGRPVALPWLSTRATT
jgi:hypothetical protein